MSGLGLLAILGCRPPFAQAVGVSTFPALESGALNHVVLTTVSDDYQVGALAELDVAAGEVHDGLTALSGDPYLDVDDGRLLQINSSRNDSVRVYEFGLWSAPDIEFSVGEGATPLSAALCGGKVWVTLLDADAVASFDPTTGREIDRVGFEDLADDDGNAEPGDLVELDGTIEVALQRLHRDDGWRSEDGWVVPVDCGTAERGAPIATGPNPGLAKVGDHELLVRTGVYYDGAGAPLFEGDLRILDLDVGRLGAPLVTEAKLARNITDVAVGPKGSVVVLLADSSDRYGWASIDRVTGAVVLGDEVDDFLTDVVVDDLDRAWISGRPGWTAPESAAGVRVVDALTAAPLLDEPIVTALAPYRLALRP